MGAESDALCARSWTFKANLSSLSAGEEVEAEPSELSRLPVGGGVSAAAGSARGEEVDTGPPKLISGVESIIVSLNVGEDLEARPSELPRLASGGEAGAVPLIWYESGTRDPTDFATGLTLTTTASPFLARGLNL